MKEEAWLVEKPSRYHFNGPGREDEAQGKGSEDGRKSGFKYYFDDVTNTNYTGGMERIREPKVRTLVDSGAMNYPGQCYFLIVEIQKRR